MAGRDHGTAPPPGQDDTPTSARLVRYGHLLFACYLVLYGGFVLLNAFAQGAALMEGRQSDDPQRSYQGNRPSATILLDRLDARSLGALIAFYEHRTFANAVLLGINPFDQFGVELGKEIARQLADRDEDEGLDPSTRALIERAGV